MIGFDGHIRRYTYVGMHVQKKCNLAKHGCDLLVTDFISSASTDEYSSDSL